MEATEIHLQFAQKTRENIALFVNEPKKYGLLPLNYAHFLRSASAYALRVSTSPQSYAAAISPFEPVKYFSEYLELCRGRNHQAAFASASLHAIDLVAIPILLKQAQLARAYILEALAVATTTPVLQSYVQGLVALATSADFEYVLPAKLRGMEHHWSLYTVLMSQLSRAADIHTIKAEIEQSFARCNSDRRLQNVGYLDPLGSNPVPWDARIAYVLALNDQRT